MSVLLALAIATLPVDVPTSGSLLLFPWFDSRPGALSVITVTNTNPVQSVNVEFVYLEEGTCNRVNRLRSLTPNDTFTGLINQDNSSQQTGFVYLVARDTVSGLAIDFDHLVAELTILDGGTGGSWGVPALTFRARTCAGDVTDLNNNGVPDLDGSEYEAASEELLFPRFEGQSAGRVTELIVLNTDTLRFGATLLTTASLLVYNDNEEAFSSAGPVSIQCMARVPLSSLGGVFDNSFLASTNQNPAEPLGGGGVENGWFRMRGLFAFAGTEAPDRTPLVGVLLARTPVPFASMPYANAEDL